MGTLTLDIERLEIAKYSLPLARRYRAGPVDVDARAGRLVRMCGRSGAVGYGEISPLPGLHEETLAQVDTVLAQVGAELAGHSFPGFDGFAQNVANRVVACARAGERACPSVVFGLQGAGAALLATEAGTTPAAVLGREPRARVQVNALFSGGAAEAAEAVAGGHLDAFGVVKVKCGLRPAAEERQVLRVLLAGLPDTTRLRLDANRGLSLEEALERFRDLPPERVEYLEEPLANPGGLAELHARTGLRIGLDETLHVRTTYDIGRAPYVAAWCLKPARIGHWQRMLFLAREAARHGAATVVSSCLESGLGLSLQAQMAAALPGATAAAGLATEDWLRVDLVAPPYDARPGFVRTADWRGTPSARVLARLRFRPVG